jgi:hypothetical protein
MFNYMVECQVEKAISGIVLSSGTFWAVEWWSGGATLNRNGGMLKLV